MAAGSIVIDLLMKTGSFETDTKRAEKRLAELKKEAEQVGVAIGAAFAAVGVAAVAMVKSSIDAMDDMSKQAQMLGMTTEALSGLTYAADLAGVGQDELRASMVRLSKAVAEGSDTLDELGISTKNADGSLKSADQVLSELADHFAKMPDGVDKTAKAVELFGRSGANLIPLLNGGSAGIADLMKEAEQLGLVLDTETSRAAEEFNDNLSRLAGAVRGVANTAAEELLPTLNNVSEMLVEVAKNEEAAAAAAAVVETAVRAAIVVFQTLVVVGSDVAFVFKMVGNEIGGWAAQLAALARGDFGQFTAISDMVKEDATRARRELDDFQRRIMSLGDPGYKDPRILGPVGSVADQTRGWGRAGGSTGGGSGKGKGGGTGRGSTRDPDADFKRYLENLNRQIRGLQELTEEEELLAEIRDRNLKFTPAQEEQLRLLARFIDADKEHKKVLEEKRAAIIAEGDAVNAANEAYQRRLEQLTDDTPTRQMERMLDDLKFLEDAFNRGHMSEQQYLEARHKRVGLTNDTMKQGIDLGEELAQIGAGALEAMAFSGRDADEVLKQLLLDIAMLIFRLQVVEPLMEQIKAASKGWGGGGGGGGGFLSDLIGGLFGGGGGGGVPPNPFYAGAMAGGGDVLPGRSYDVGEFGPERFVPRTAGRIIPASGSGSGTTIINQTTGRVDNVVERRISPTERALILQENRQAILTEMSDPNSSFSQRMQANFTVRRNRA